MKIHNNLLTGALLLVTDRETEPDSKGETFTFSEDEMVEGLSELGALREELLYSTEWKIVLKRKDELADPDTVIDCGGGVDGWNENHVQARSDLESDIAENYGHEVGSDANSEMVGNLEKIAEFAVFTNPETDAESSDLLTTLRDRFRKACGKQGPLKTLEGAFSFQTGRTKTVKTMTKGGRKLAHRS